MNLNDADIIYADEMIDDLKTVVKPTSAIGESLSFLSRRFALVTRKDDPNYQRHVEKLSAAYTLKKLDYYTVRNTSKPRVWNFISNVNREIAGVRPDALLLTARGAIVCGAGAPLLDDIDEIAKSQANGALIVATNRAVVSLAARGVKADLAFVAEFGWRPNQLVRDVPTVIDRTANPRWATDVDRSFLISNADPAFDQMAREYLGEMCYANGPSVTTLATSWLLAHGVTDIVLSGCPTCDVGGYVPESTDTGDRKYEISVKCYDGETRLTTIQMADELQWWAKLRALSGVSLKDSGARSAIKAGFAHVRLGDWKPCGDNQRIGISNEAVERGAWGYRASQFHDLFSIERMGYEGKLVILNQLPLLSAYCNEDLLDLIGTRSAKAIKSQLQRIIHTRSTEMIALWRGGTGVA
jgi:hypothetical protein